MKAIKLFSMAVAALMMAACSSEENEILQNTQQPGTMHFTATIAAPSGDATTRTVYTEVGTTINVKWKVGDQIALVHNGQKDVAEVKTVDDVTGKATIEANIKGSPSDNDDVYLAYPADAVESAVPELPFPFTPNQITFDKVKSQDGTLEFIQNNLDLRMGTGKLAVSGSDVSLKESVSIPSLICIWKLTLQDNAATPNALNATKLTFKNNTFTQAEATSAAKSDYYLCVVPSFIPDASGTFSFEATVGSDTYTFSKTGLNLTAGKYYQSTVTLTKPAPSYDKEMNLSTTSSDVTVPAGEHWLIKGYAEDICVTIGNGATVTLNGVDIYMDNLKPCIKCSGDATIILADGTTNTLTATASDYGGGIQAGPTGKTLTIKGNTGVLNVEIKHDSDAAAIGAYDGTACGDIVIEGGVINATSQNGAAIGACYEAACGNITISGGTVTAKAGGAGGFPGVGIGGHYDTACGNIKITGGTVTATGFDEPGIGGDNICGDITISGGTVKATKGEYANKCIGTNDGGTCGTITIGGTVYWDGSNYQNDGDTYLTQSTITYPAP